MCSSFYKIVLRFYMKTSAYTLDFSLFLQFKNNLMDLVVIKTDIILQF